jgi:hypothetical protein
MMYPLVKELAAGEGTGVCRPVGPVEIPRIVSKSCCLPRRQQERTTKRPGFLCEGAPVRRLTQEW